VTPASDVGGDWQTPPTDSDHDEQANGGLVFDPEAIDPGGPIDPAISRPQPVGEVSRPAAFTLMAPGWYPPEHAITQAYGCCLTDDGLVALVHTHDGFRNLPGGQLELGETACDALVREIAEEACASVTACQYLACQHVWDPQAPDGPASHSQTCWWAGIELDPWQPNHEKAARQLVPPSDVLATLSWRRKQIVGRLLALAWPSNMPTAVASDPPIGGRESGVAAHGNDAR
jgi:8-oxo-dGTP pyrophosphatase MutT (NUDIX family)